MNNKNEFDKACKELVELKGHKVGFRTEECKQWQISHDNSCKGCQYEMGCSQVLALQLASFDTDPLTRIDQILDAKDAKTVRTLPFNMREEDGEIINESD